METINRELLREDILVLKTIIEERSCRNIYCIGGGLSTKVINQHKCIFMRTARKNKQKVSLLACRKDLLTKAEDELRKCLLKAMLYSIYK